MDVKQQLLNTFVAKVRHVSLQHAHSFRLCRDGLLSAPRSIMLDGIISYGGGTGVGMNLVNKAFGEYFERNHFFTAVPLTEEKKLKYTKPAAHQKHLASLCQSEDNQQVLDHSFSFTQVHNLYNHEPCEYLYNAISLRTMKSDQPFLNVSDSCACASHTNKNDALYHSLIEFLERQALLGSWMSKKIKYRINPALLREMLPYSKLVDTFIDNGDIYIFEMGHHLPGYNIIIYYFSHSEHDAVQYCVGTKTAGSLLQALNGAFEELYQCYTFLYGSVLKTTNLENKAGTGYHLAFIDYNNQQTQSLIPYITPDQPYYLNHKEEVAKLPVYDYEDLIAGLKEVSPNVYYYHFYDEPLALHFTKIVSPDFFAHMSVDKTLNLQCSYAKKLAIDSENAYLKKLPFP